MIASAFLVCPAYSVDAHTLAPLARPDHTSDVKFAFFARCHALSKLHSKTLNLRFAETLGVSEDHVFFERSLDGAFSRPAVYFAFKAAGHDWNEIWEVGQRNGGRVPEWTIALAIGVHRLARHSAGIYKRHLENAKKCGQADFALLKSDLALCASENLR